MIAHTFHFYILHSTGALPYKVKVVIAGNHDLTFDDNITEASLRTFGVQKSTVESYLSERGLKSVKQMLTSAIYLEDSLVTVCGIKIYGAPWYVTVDHKHTMQLLKHYLDQSV